MLWDDFEQLPSLTRESRRFIAAFIAVDQNIEDLAAELNADFFDVIQKLSEPTIQVWVRAINALKNNERRERALRTLDAALTNDPNPNNIRRAASRILRHLETTRPRTKPDGAVIQPVSPDPPQPNKQVGRASPHASESTTAPTDYVAHTPADALHTLHAHSQIRAQSTKDAEASNSISRVHGSSPHIETARESYPAFASDHASFPFL